MINKLFDKGKLRDENDQKKNETHDRKLENMFRLAPINKIIDDFI